MQFLCKKNKIASNIFFSIVFYLILIELTVLESWLSFWLKSDDDKTNKDVDHEEGNDDDVDEVEYGHIWTVVVLGTNVWSIGVNGNIQDSAILFASLSFMNIMNNSIIWMSFWSIKNATIEHILIWNNKRQRIAMNLSLLCIVILNKQKLGEAVRDEGKEH